MRTLAWFLGLATLAGALLVACTAAQNQPVAPAPPGAAEKPVAGKPGPSRDRQGWDFIVAEAKKEGKVTIMGGIIPTLQTALRDAIRAKYGIDLEFTVGRGAELVEKLRAERQAGLYLLDLHLAGATTATLQLKPGGFLDPMDKLIILPEASDAKAWFGGRHQWVDNEEKYIFTNSLYAAQTMAVNTDMVKPGEIKSWRDVLNPKWKGQIVINDPTVAGNGARWYGVVSTAIMNVDFMKELAKQEPIFNRDQRLQVEWVAKGKYPIILGPQVPNVTEFRKVNAPIAWVQPQEGTYLSGGNTALSLSNRPAHPYAAQVFINWLLTREGATILARETLFQSARLDVDTSFLKPDEIRDPAVKYFVAEKEDFLATQAQHMKAAKEIFGPVMK